MNRVKPSHRPHTYSHQRGPVMDMSHSASAIRGAPMTIISTALLSASAI